MLKDLFHFRGKQRRQAKFNTQMMIAKRGRGGSVEQVNPKIPKGYSDYSKNSRLSEPHMPNTVDS